MNIFMSLVLFIRILNGRIIIRLRRTFKDFVNLYNFITKDLRIKADGIIDLNEENVNSSKEI